MAYTGSKPEGGLVRVHQNVDLKRSLRFLRDRSAEGRKKLLVWDVVFFFFMYSLEVDGS